MRDQVESPAVFECAGKTLLGIVHAPAQPSRTGVVIVVGGPQYRVGSHRQFVHTARRLAEAGYPVLRFDYRGMGDSEGEPRSFDSLTDDIRAAVNRLSASQDVTKVVLFGLCDAASANLIYCALDERVEGLILLNPWVRTTAGEARSYVRHYYAQRFFSRGFWKKALSGKFQSLASLRGLLGNVVAAQRGSSFEGEGSDGFIERMRVGLESFRGSVLFLISGKDLTAQEFVDLCAGDARWRAAMAQRNVERRAFPSADHTFSVRAELDSANAFCVEWMQAKFGGGR